MAKSATKKHDTKPAATPKKSETLVSLLKRDGGATLGEISAATSWLPHSARAMLTGLRKKGYELEKSKVEGLTRYAPTREPTA